MKPGSNAGAAIHDREPRTAATDHITVCICTYRRAELLERLLRAVAKQVTGGMFHVSCAVIDNDPLESARPVVDRIAFLTRMEILYAVEPARNLAIVRNKSLDLVRGNLLAFIDDDEVPQKDWLMRLWQALRRLNADAVLGPVRPYFDASPPSWIVRSRICERPSLPTDTEVHWRQTRTGNVLLNAELLKIGMRFNPDYNLGGEDVDFFRRAAQAGKRFFWCEEAPAYELVPSSRLTRCYYLRRALLQGRISSTYVVDRTSLFSRIMIATRALAAVAVYGLALPFLFLAGQHLGMKFLIKECHHIGRLLTTLGVAHSSSRAF